MCKTGQLSQSLGHGIVEKDASSDDSAWNLVLQEEQIARLVPTSPKTPEEASVNTRIELETDDTLITGDPVETSLALDVPKSVADKLGLGEWGWGGREGLEVPAQTKPGAGSGAVGGGRGAEGEARKGSGGEGAEGEARRGRRCGAEGQGVEAGG